MAKIHSDRWLEKLLKKLHLQLAMYKALTEERKRSEGQFQRKPLISMIILDSSSPFYSGRGAQTGCTLNFNRRSQPAMLSF
jgi:hypothetical protein